MTPIAAATGVNRVQGESNVTEAQAFEAVKFLIELGVDPKAAVSTGENAIFGAAYRGWSSVVQLLADHGTDVNAISKSGTTPWRAASGQGDRLGGVLFNTETAALLVKLGADPTLGKPCMAQTRCR
jgi:ankyrin repeat protein